MGSNPILSAKIKLRAEDKEGLDVRHVRPGAAACALCLAAAMLLCGCGTAESAPADSLEAFPNRIELPLMRQGTVYSCGIAALHSLLR